MQFLHSSLIEAAPEVRQALTQWESDRHSEFGKQHLAMPVGGEVRNGLAETEVVRSCKKRYRFISYSIGSRCFGVWRYYANIMTKIILMFC